MAQVMTQRGAFVGGEWLPGDGDAIEVRSPGSGEVLGSVRAASDEQVDAAVASAAAAFESWRRTSVLERVEICRRAYDICMDRAEEIARMITRETGKTIRESREEMVEYTADHFRRAGEDVLRHSGQVLPSTQGRTHKRILIVQEPVGVVAAISPWNFPVDIAGIPIVYGLAYGCTTVWKPSELAPLCAELFVDVLHDAGFPPGTVNLVHGRGEVGAALTRSQRRRLGRLHRLDCDRREGRARGRAQEPHPRAGRQRPADRARRRQPRGRGGRRGDGLLLPGRAGLHGCRARARAQRRP